jgi:hypothetical protein
MFRHCWQSPLAQCCHSRWRSQQWRWLHPGRPPCSGGRFPRRPRSRLRRWSSASLGLAVLATRLTSLLTPQHRSSRPTQSSIYFFLTSSTFTVKSYSQSHFSHIFPTDHIFSCIGWGERGLFLSLYYNNCSYLSIYFLKNLSLAYMTYVLYDALYFENK